MVEQQSDYVWSDVWFLLAVEYATRDGKRAPLSEIIAVADAMNIAILTPCEIKSATFKLTRDRWISFEYGKFLALAKTRKRFRELPGGHPMDERFAIVQTWLDATGYSDKSNPNVLTSDDFPEITDTMVKNAVREYRQQFESRDNK